MKKIISITLAVTTICWMAGVVAFAPVASAITIVEGDIVSPDASYTDADGNTYYPYDVFIIKYVGAKQFKRLVLNPQVFESYGHLEWGNIKTGTVAELEAFTTSSLTRAEGDDKVYKLFPDGDIGTKRWVDTLALFTSLGYDWDAVYVINSTDRDNYTTGATMAGTEPEVTGEMTLSLASTTPAAATIPNNAQGVTFLTVKVTGSGTINQITVKRLGAGRIADFGEVYIYANDVRLTSGRSISSSTSKVSFINLGLAAPTTFSVVADMSSATGGDVNYFGIESSSDVTSNATVGGTFPLNGNPMAVSGAGAGTLTIAASGSGSRNVTIGAVEVEISQFKITASTEGANLYRIQLFNSGTATPTYITNLKLKDNTLNTVATATQIGSDGYVTFVFDSPYYIKKGDHEIFRIFADVGGVKPERTIILYMELATDLLGLGTTYGFGMAVTDDDFDAAGSTSAEGIDITCKGGDLTLNKIGPNASSIGIDTDDTVFLEFTITAAADITIKRTTLIFCLDPAGTGTYEEFDTVTSHSAGGDMEDIKIVDKDTGTVIVGPKDGTYFDDTTTSGASNNACPSSKDGVSEDFVDTFDLVAGETRTLQVIADVKTTNSLTDTEVSSGDVIKFILYSYASLVTSSGNINNMKYTGTTDAVISSAIVPSGNIAGEEMTLESPSLAMTLAAAPSGSDGDSDEKVYIKGQTGVEAVGIIFTAGTASDITINSITLVSFTTLDTGAAFVAGVADGNSVKDSIGSVYIYDTATDALIPGSSAKGFTSGDNDEHIDYTGLSWTIPAGEDKTMLVKVDISSAGPASGSGSADLWVSFDVENTSDISAVDKDGNSVTASGDDANGGVDTNTDFGIADYGSLAIDQASDTPDSSIVVMDTEDNEISKFKFTGTYEAWQIEKFSILLDDGGSNGDAEDRDNFSGVSLKYQTEAQWDSDDWTISAGKTFGATASLAFSFSGTDRIYVPKDDDSFVTVLVDIQGYDGGNGAKSKKRFKMYPFDGSTSWFKAYGAQSGKQLFNYSTDGALAADFNLHYVARSKPVFAKVAWAGDETELARFSITAVGEDIIFKNTDFDSGWGANFDGSTTPASAYLEFDVIASGTDTESSSFYLYDWTETVISSVPNAGVYEPGTTQYDGSVATIGFHFENDSYNKTITGGTTREFHINIDGADITDFDNSDEYIYLKLTGDEGGTWATGSADDRIIIYHDDTSEEGISGGSLEHSGDPEERFMMPGGVKNIGPLPITFRTLRGTVAPG